MVEKKRSFGKITKKDVHNIPQICKKTNVCCVPSCSNTCKQFYLFPSDPERTRVWNAVLYKYEENKMKNIKNKLICKLHFEERYLTNNGSLTHDAIPTLYLSEEEEQDQESELSDYNDVIESFNSSYPSFDDSYMMEANVEICETGEDLKLENDNEVSFD